MKRGIAIVVLIILSLGMCVFSVISRTYDLNRVVNSEDYTISTKVKLLAYVYGGYSELYNRKLKKGISPREAVNYISKGLGDKLYEQAETEKVQPKDASVKFTGNYHEPFIYYKEIIGRSVDMERLYRDTVKSLDDGSEVVFHIIEIEPTITLNQLKDKTALRAEFKTNYLTSSVNRKSNIELAARYLNGYIIKPEGTMSFNQVVGPRTIARGFKHANIIYKGEMVQGTGGGVCQVSSTLYNACLLSGLTILNATRHSRIVPYLPPSRDAMVSNTNDLLIANMEKDSVFIVTKTINDDIYISIYGRKVDHELRIKTKLIDLIKPKKDKIIVEGDNLSDAIRQALESNDEQLMRNIAYTDIIKSKPRCGLISEAYLEKYIDGILIDTKLISHDVYYPQQGEIIRRVI